ncbi:MAG: alpha/beta-hydrolase family protein [Actinomycetes bacterium]
MSSRAGVLLGSYFTGASYQPNLLSRGTRDQALISGVAAASALGWGTSAHSFLRSTADRLPWATRSVTGRIASGLVVDAAAFAVGGSVARLLPPDEHESGQRALVRLAATSTAAAAAAGLGADALEMRRNRPGGRAVSLVAALATAGASYAFTRPRHAVRGAAMSDDNRAHENVLREVSAGEAIGSGAAITVALLGVARAETALSGLLSRGASHALGGSPQDHRTAGRAGALAVMAGLGWSAVTAVNHMLTKSGDGIEADAPVPDLPEVTGGPGSLIPWTDQSRESARWLSMTLRSAAISDVMGEKAKQPIRVYASLDAARTGEERAALLLAEIDRTGALNRSAFALFSPTGSGYVNYVACETFEYLTRGDCASAGIQYSVLPSALSLTKVGPATEQTRIVVNGIVERLLAMPVAERPKFFLFGESLGSQVSQEMFRGQGGTGPDGVGLDAAVWVGTPASTRWRTELWGHRSVADAPAVGPGSIYLPRAIRDWRALPKGERAKVRFLLLQNGDDPIPKFGARVLWRRPDWLGPEKTRPPGAPSGTRWMPVTTFIATFVDMQNALVPTPGDFDEGGHDYRREIPEAVRTVFQLEATDEQMDRVQSALRRRELAWETARQWDAAEAKPTPDRAEAERAAKEKVSTWTGHDVDSAEIGQIIAGETGND